MKKSKSTEHVTLGDADDLIRMLPKTNYHSAWASPEAFYKHLRNQDPKLQWDDAGRCNNKYGDFYGTDTYEEALDLAQNGWDGGVAKVESVRNRIQMLNPLAPRLVNYSIAGAVPCIPRAVAGNPLNMRTPDTTKSKKRPVITIVSNMCVNGGSAAESITNRAAVVAALIDEMEGKGFSCEVVATALTAPTNFSAATSVIVKTSSQPVDIRRLAFAIGHVSMFRRFFFADWGGHPSCKELGYGLGRAMDFKPTETCADKNIYYLPGGEGKMKYFKDEETSATKGLNYMIDSLRYQGCPAFPKLDFDERQSLSKEETVDYDEDEYD